jgi:hypothetical protein
MCVVSCYTQSDFTFGFMRLFYGIVEAVLQMR